MRPNRKTDVPRSRRNYKVAAAYIAAIGSLIVGVSLVFLLPSDVSVPAADGSDSVTVFVPVNETPVQLARSLDVSDFGLSGPFAIALVPDTGGLYVVGSGGAVELSPAGFKVRSIEIPERFNVSPMVTYDEAGDRLLVLTTSPLRLIEIDLRQESGDRASVTHDLSAVDVRDPIGVTVDATTNELVILDADGPSLVRVQTKPGGFLWNTAATVDLGSNGIHSAGGIAFDRSAGHVRIIDSSQGRLYELDVDGRVLDAWVLTGFEFDDMIPMAYAPSGDQTDDPATTSLYVAVTFSNTDAGRILELSSTMTNIPPVFAFTSKIINKIDVKSFTPPSPDPTGLGYVDLTGRLVMVDSEVDETVTGISHFEGVNLWQIDSTGKIITTANISQLQPTDVPMTNEPTGISWNPLNGHYFVSDDNVLRIFDLDPGRDGQVGTADDSWTSFPTSISGNNDPEGVAYDTKQNSLFVTDGLNQEVYQYTTTGELVYQFDVARYGLIDPEGIAYNPISASLFILGKGSPPIVLETTTTGDLIRAIVIDAGPAAEPAGIVYAPASDGSATYSFFISFRGVDNNDDPDEIDGVVLEMSAPQPIGHRAPTVNAGPDTTVVLPAEASLQGMTADDGLPVPPGLLLPVWSQVSGPGLVTFSEPTSERTSAAFTLPGTYVLRLSSFDGELTGIDDVQVIVTGTGEVSYFNVTIKSGSDDAEERADGAVVVTGADLDMMLDRGSHALVPNSAVGLRFNSIPIPRGATIVNAYVSFQADEANAEATALVIRGESVTDSAPFADTVNNITARKLTSSTIGWTPESWFIVGQRGLPQRTPNLARVIQEIVDHVGWTENHSLSLIISGTGVRVATAFETAPESAAVLHLEWISKKLIPDWTQTVVGNRQDIV